MRIVTLSVVCLLYALGFGLVLFNLPLMAYNLSSNVSWVGLLAALPAVASMLVAIPVGALIDRHGRRKIIYIGLCVMLLAAVLMSFAGSLIGFLAFVLLFGVASQMIYASLKVHLLDMAPKGSTSKYFGVAAAAFQMGLALSPIVGGILLGVTLSPSTLFIILILILFFLCSSIDDVKETGADKVKLTGGFRFFKNIKGIGLFLLFVTVLFTTFEGLVWAIEPLFKDYYGFDGLTVGVILSMFVLPFILFNIPAGIIADRFGKMRILGPSLFVAGLFTISFSLVQTPLSLLIYAFASTIFLAFTWVAIGGLIVEHSPSTRRGALVGVWNVFEDIGYIIGPLFGGYIASYSTLKMPFTLVGGLMVLAAVYLTVFLHEKR